MKNEKMTDWDTFDLYTEGGKYRSLQTGKPSLNSGYICPLCKQIVNDNCLDDVAEKDYSYQSFDGHHMKFHVAQRSIKLCDKCNSMIRKRRIAVIILTIVMWLGIGMIGELFKDYLIVPVILAIPYIGALVSVVIFRSDTVFVLVGKLFRIKWRLRDYGIY